MELVNIAVHGTSLYSEEVSGWFGLFTSENFFSYLILSFMCGLGLFLSYMYIILT